MPHNRKEFKLLTMMGETVGKASLTRAEGMGSREQVEVLALETSLATWTASTEEKAERQHVEGLAAGAATVGAWAGCGVGGAGARGC